ncbi:DUF4822 domain-containing protein [Nocardiopsis yanglingensis]|uniref:DUF4822 domain-containing protein n=1 Tax=unclassified Stenotrophomonas TaxID=196198 RepID=UPI000B7590E6|nr:DUF4822 domain-containing protein [Stenotrophomonas sp. CC120222-04]SNT82735.1 protein of unknown function [Stenotrophomonas sp. CC120222-04]
MPRLPLALLLACATFRAPAADCPHAGAAARTLAATAWLTTAVYEGDDRTRNLIDRYPAVVGVSLWDACSNRFEYFDPEDGASRLAKGGGGYFLFTGDGIHQVTLPDHGPVLRRRMEVLDAGTFTYSRQVPRAFMEGHPEITLHVEHTPFRGALPLPAQPAQPRSTQP